MSMIMMRDYDILPEAMQKKIKSSLKKASPAKPTLSLTMWIGFWSLVFCTMIMIVATFTSAIQPLLNLPAYDAAADIAEIKQDLDQAVTALEAAE
jgi:hypothetical protein